MVAVFTLLGGIIGFFISREVNIMVDFKSIIDIICGIPFVIVIIVAVVGTGGMAILGLPFFLVIGGQVYQQIVKDIPTINLSVLIIVAGLFLGGITGGIISSRMHPKPKTNQNIPLQRFKRSTTIGIIYFVVGMSILVGFFVFPFIESDAKPLAEYTRIGNLSGEELNDLIQSTTRIHLMSYSAKMALADEIFSYMPILFAIISVWCFIKSVNCIFGTYKGKPTFFIRFFRFISALSLFFILPIVTIMGFYLFKLGYLGIFSKNGWISSIRLQDIQKMFDSTRPDTGFWLILLPCLLASVISVIRIILSAYQPVQYVQYYANSDGSYSYSTTPKKPFVYVPFINLPKAPTQSELNQTFNDMKKGLEQKDLDRKAQKLINYYNSNKDYFDNWSPPKVDFGKTYNKKK